MSNDTLTTLTTTPETPETPETPDVRGMILAALREQRKAVQSPEGTYMLDNIELSVREAFRLNRNSTALARWLHRPMARMRRPFWRAWCRAARQTVKVCCQISAAFCSTTPLRGEWVGSGRRCRQVTRPLAVTTAARVLDVPASMARMASRAFMASSVGGDAVCDGRGDVRARVFEIRMKPCALWIPA